ncbi:MAG: class I SAM-dependent methyltransferase [Candidatus Omnitrophota bacterium]
MDNQYNHSNHYSFFKGLLEAHRHLMGENDAKFFERVYLKDLTIYRRRLNAIGFDAGSRILDAGCGFGQWVTVMGESFEQVVAVDHAPHRLIILDKILDHLGIRNVTLQYADLAALPVENDSFSHVFCYGALFITDWKQTLREFYRVLQKGGKLYFTANGLGWYIHLWQNRPNATPDYDPRLNAAKAFYNTGLYNSGQRVDFGDGSLIIATDEIADTLKSIGFQDIQIAGEGSIGCPAGENLSFFQSSYEGLEGAYEVLALK